MKNVMEKLAASGHLSAEQVERIGENVSSFLAELNNDPEFQKEAEEKLAVNLGQYAQRLGLGAATTVGALGALGAYNLAHGKIQKWKDDIGKAKGYNSLVQAVGENPELTAAFLLIEKLTDVAGIQAQAIRDLPIEKVIVWDGGGEGGMANLGKRVMGALPPMHDLAKLVGLELPEYLGSAAGKDKGAGEPPEKPGPPASRKKSAKK